MVWGYHVCENVVVLFLCLLVKDVKTNKINGKIFGVLKKCSYLCINKITIRGGGNTINSAQENMNEDFSLWLNNNPSGFDHHDPDYFFDEDEEVEDSVER